ncbi:MAG: hypothetical protein GXY72_04705 [Deltaproteobacteria bacterium]|nr:hypothetical protein [Deltaproteobacteria bacterium]
MKILHESMNQSFGAPAAALVLMLPPVVSIAVVLWLERFVGILVCIVLFPVIYVLSLFLMLCGMAIVTRSPANKKTPAHMEALEERVRLLEELVGQLALENALLKKARRGDLAKEPEKTALPHQTAPRQASEREKNITR